MIKITSRPWSYLLEAEFCPFSHKHIGLELRLPADLTVVISGSSAAHTHYHWNQMWYAVERYGRYIVLPGCRRGLGLGGPHRGLSMSCCVRGDRDELGCVHGGMAREFLGRSGRRLCGGYWVNLWGTCGRYSIQFYVSECHQFAGCGSLFRRFVIPNRQISYSWRFVHQKME